MNRVSGWTPCESNGLRVSSGVDSFKRLSVAALCSCVLLLAPMVRADDTPTINGPRISLSATEIDLGEVKPVDGHEFAMEVQNKGMDTLKIGPIVPLCTCVQATVDTLEVKAGETKSFSIRTMLATYPSTEIKGSVRLHTNDPNQPDVDIQVKGRIFPEYIVEPVALDFGRVKAGETTVRTFIVRQTGDELLVVERVETSKGLTASLEEILPGEGATQASLKQYKVALRLASDLAPEIFNGTVTLFTNIARVPRADLKVMATVVGLDLSVTPKILAFGTATPGEKLGEFVVEGDGLTALETNSEGVGLEFAVVEESPGKKYRVEVKATDEIAQGTVARTVTVHAEDGTSETSVQVQVFGRVD